jgi:hypothetical protein
MIRRGLPVLARRDEWQIDPELLLQLATNAALLIQIGGVEPRSP